MLIGFLGKKGSGKTTASNFLVNELNFINKTFAEPLKKACQDLFLLEDDQIYGNKKEEIDKRWGCSPRKILQFIGTDLLRNNINKIMPNIGDNIFIDIFKVWYEENKEKNIVISDVRFKNEIDFIHNNGGIIIKLDRNNDNNDKHESEYINNLEYDYIINNNFLLENLNKNIIDIYNVRSIK